MYVKKNFNVLELIKFTWFHIVWISIWATIVPVIYYIYDLQWLVIPWVPLSIIATAVAFYIGFKNNSAYDRLWEARKIWGAIINSSRMLGATVRAYVSNQFEEGSNTQVEPIHKELIYRHIAYLYVLRSQLLIPTSWEHVNQSAPVRRLTEMRLKKIGKGLSNDGNLEAVLDKYLEKAEEEKVVDFTNTATQLLDNQSQQLKDLREKGLVDDFRHMELQNLINDFYTHQGKCERIKKFPLPRQYGSISFVFVGLFIFLLPFGLVGQFATLGTLGLFLSIPFIVLVAWVYIMMELVGDYSENPFEGLGNDIPMLSLCRVIEIDLLEMIGETEIPASVKPTNGVLM